MPNDFKDYDMQTSPIAARTNGVPVVIGAGKMGYVYEIDAATGGLIWKTPVGEHNGHDNDSLQALEHKSTLKAPLTILPGSLGGVLSNPAVAGHSVYVVTWRSRSQTWISPSLRRPPARLTERSRRSTSRLAGSNGTRRSQTCRSGLPRSRTTSSSPP